MSSLLKDIIKNEQRTESLAMPPTREEAEGGPPQEQPRGNSDMMLEAISNMLQKRRQ